MRLQVATLFGTLARQRSAAFLLLFTLDATCRALLITIVPQRAFELLGSAERVTLLYLGASMAGLATNLAVPWLLRFLSRRMLLVAATFGYVASGLLFATGSVTGLVLAVTINIAVGATLEVLINLFMLEHVARRDLNTFEPKRLLLAGTAFVIGPLLGVALHTRVAENLTFVVTAVLAMVFLACFLAMRLVDPAAPVRGDSLHPPPHPLSALPRFASQPRLVLAWALAVGRNGWWLMYFVYTPILVASFGYSQELAGLLVSVGLMPMFLVRVWAGYGKRFGIRRLLIVGYALTAVLTMAAGLTVQWPPLCLALICFSAFAATTIDGAGNVPFLRAVHPFERAPMTAVFMTFRHAASLSMPAVFAVVLLVAPVSGVFVATGAIGLGMSLLSRYLPKRM